MVHMGLTRLEQGYEGLACGSNLIWGVAPGVPGEGSIVQEQGLDTKAQLSYDTVILLL